MNARRVRVDEDEQLDDDERRRRSACSTSTARKARHRVRLTDDRSANRAGGQVQRVAEDHEQAEPADALDQCRRPSHMRRPAPAGRDAERKPAEQQKQTRRQPALKLPDVKPAADLVAAAPAGRLPCGHTT